LAPRARRVAYGATAALTVAAIGVPLLAVTSGGAVHSVFLGTGDSRGVGGALVSLLRLHGAPLVLLSRVTPLLISALLALWVVRRLGDRARGSSQMLALITCSLGLRLVFEQQIFEYYFMALVVTLVLLDVVVGRLRGALVAWLVALFIVDIGQVNGVDHHPDFIRLGIVAVAAGVLVWQVLRGAPRREAVPWVALIACTVAAWPNVDPFGLQPVWFWQIVLVGWGLTLAATALARAMRDAATAEPPGGGHVRVLGPGTPAFARPGPLQGH
jgi:hypothetical protein